MTNDRTLRSIRQAAELIAMADGLLITAGAGMGVDSGLPDFRGSEGFWRAYPALGKRRVSFEEMAQPSWFVAEPQTAWAFYGHRQRLYRETRPHRGFGLLLEWGRALPGGHFVVTSNVDGHFEAAGFDPERVFEVHGNIHAHQCVLPCLDTTWQALPTNLDIDFDALRARGTLPRCPHCGELARPNVLMFGDGTWVSTRADQQYEHYQSWRASVAGRRVVVLELGAGRAIPTIRRMGEDLAARGLATLVRINPDASDGDEPAIPIRMKALEALAAIGEQLPLRSRNTSNT